MHMYIVRSHNFINFFLVFYFTVLDEGDIEILKTYVSLILYLYRCSSVPTHRSVKYARKLDIDQHIFSTVHRSDRSCEQYSYRAIYYCFKDLLSHCFYVELSDLNVFLWNDLTILWNDPDHRTVWPDNNVLGRTGHFCFVWQGAGLYSRSIKKVEDDIQGALKKVNELTGKC